MQAVRVNVSGARAMRAYAPQLKCETFSYLPQLTDNDIRKQIDYMVRNGWTPALEFSEDSQIYLNTRMGPGYYDNRYWSMYKLPLFGCRDGSEVLREIDNCKREFPTAKIRVVGFDARRQVQAVGFTVRR